MKFYKFNFTGDYHIREDGSHDIKIIHRNPDGTEIAYCYGEVVPEYGEEIDGIEGWTPPAVEIPKKHLC